MKKLLVVGTFIAGATVGFAACGALVVDRVLKSDRHREGLTKAVSEKMDKWLYGEEKCEGRYRTNSKVSYVSYRSFHDNRYNGQKVEECFIFETREKAENVLNEISELMNTHGQVSLADVYDLCAMMPRATDYECGWNTIEGMKVIKTRNGYELYLPKPSPIEV